MVDKIIFTVTPIFCDSFLASICETWMYQVAQHTIKWCYFYIKIQDTQITPLLMIIVVFIGLDSVAYISGYFKNGQDLILSISQRMNIAHDL